MGQVGIRSAIDDVTAELLGVLAAVDDGELAELERLVMAAPRVFVAGAGRSLLSMRALAMRLVHLGRTAFVVGETVTPAIGHGDLLLVASASGSTATLVAIAQRALAAGADVALLTARPHSPLASLAGHVVTVPAHTPKAESAGTASVQLGGSTFEQAVLVLGDSLVVNVARSEGVDDATLMARHANLE